MTLRGALADALVRARLAGSPDGDADRVLSDPAFRAALVESVAEGLRGYRHGQYGVEKGTREGRVQSGEREFAAAIVARMLRPASVRDLALRHGIPLPSEEVQQRRVDAVAPPPMAGDMEDDA